MQPCREDFLISVEDFTSKQKEQDLLAVDASWHMPASGRDAYAEYRAGHIPGAVFFDIDAIADRSSSLPHMLPAPDDFAHMVGEMGIAETTPLVVYDSMGLFSAPRAWWTFRVMGAHNIRILDGGLPAWIAAGLSLEQGDVHRQATIFKIAFDPTKVRDLTAMRAHVEKGDALVLDARSRERFLGLVPEPREGVRSGHMPGARSLPFDRFIAEGRLKSTAEIQRILADVGIDLSLPLVTSCGSGITAAVLSLALEIAGAQEHALYDGSWTEWGGRDDTPIQKGALEHVPEKLHDFSDQNVRSNKGRGE